MWWRRGAGRHDECVVVPGLLAERALNAVQDFDQVSPGAAAGVQHLYMGTGEAEGFVELGTQQMIDALHHVANDLARGVPDAKLLAQLGVEGFEEWLVEVLDSVFFTKGGKEVRLNAVEGLGRVVEDLADLDRVERTAFRDGVEEGSEDSHAQVLSGKPPVETAGMRGVVGRTTPEDPGGEDAVKKCLDEGRAEEVFAFLSFKRDAERCLQGGLYGVEGADGVLGRTVRRFAGVGGEQFGDILRLHQRDFAREHARKKVGKSLSVAPGESRRGEVP